MNKESNQNNNNRQLSLNFDAVEQVLEPTQEEQPSCKAKAIVLLFPVQSHASKAVSSFRQRVVQELLQSRVIID